MGSSPLLIMKNISFRYPGTEEPACRNISLQIDSGTLHILKGDNGAGKTTLVKIMDSILVPDSGEIKFNCLKEEIGMVSQNPHLTPELSVLENVFLGHGSLFGLRPALQKKNRELCARTIDEWRFDLIPEMKASKLNWEQRQQCEWLEHIIFSKKILLLDEPKTGNTPESISVFHSRIKRYLENDRAIVWITHKNPEPKRISVSHLFLKNGSLIPPPVATEGKTTNRLPPVNETGKVILRMKQISAHSHGFPISRFDLVLKENEITGICGIRNQGLSTLEDLLGGWIKPDSGTLIYEEDKKTNWNQGYMKAKRIAYIPSERIARGSSVNNTLAENFLIRENQDSLFINKKKFRLTHRFHFSIKGRADQKLGELSGGNIQKTILSREIDFSEKLLILCEPERGLDSEALDRLYQLIIKQSQQKKAVLILSTDPSFIRSYCYRSILLHEGRIEYDGLSSDLSDAESDRIISGRHSE